MKIIQPEAHILPMSGDILKHVERCGRIAYKSEDAITECSYVRFIQNIIKRGHESVLEHGNYVFGLEGHEYEKLLRVKNEVQEWAIHFIVPAEEGYSIRLRFSCLDSYIVSGNIRAWRDFIRLCRIANIDVPDWLHVEFNGNPAFDDLGLDLPVEYTEYSLLSREDLTPAEADIHWTETVHFICSRAISHELVRHRALSPTQESQRYCNYSKGKFGGEITFIEPMWTKDDELQRRLWSNTMEMLEDGYLGFLQVGRQPQEAREVLPNSTKTELVMTGTLGEWKHFFDLRCADDAHPEMRRIAIPLKAEFGW